MPHACVDSRSGCGNATGCRWMQLHPACLRSGFAIVRRDFDIQLGDAFLNCLASGERGGLLASSHACEDLLIEI